VTGGCEFIFVWATLQLKPRACICANLRVILHALICASSRNASLVRVLPSFSQSRIEHTQHSDAAKLYMHDVLHLTAFLSLMRYPGERLRCMPRRESPLSPLHIAIKYVFSGELKIAFDRIAFSP
jgi:hypothetical protein